MSDLEDLFTIYHIQILDINVEMDVENVQLPNIIECKVGRSIQYKMSTIPSITNEDPIKFDESLPITPISIEYNLGRFFKSKNPP